MLNWTLSTRKAVQGEASKGQSLMGIAEQEELSELAIKVPEAWGPLVVIVPAGLALGVLALQVWLLGVGLGSVVLFSG